MTIDNFIKKEKQFLQDLEEKLLDSNPGDTNRPWAKILSHALISADY